MARQVLGSLLAAVVLVAVVIVVVTWRIGPTSTAELDAREERLDQRIDAAEERRKDREDALEDQRDR
jgi:F0F1-type ATP synthase membrane subunit b/b'